MKKSGLLFLALLLCVSMLASCGAPTVSIDEDGYWVINGERTDVLARGTDGKDGKDGKDGADGTTSDVARKLGYIVVTDYFTPSILRDVTDDIQRVISTNPHRTIFFPDGTYLISGTIKTSANPDNSTHLVFSNYATLKASGEFEGSALLSLGGAEPFNNVTKPGSNYGVDGGIFDCSGITNGIEIASGRETTIRNCSIKNAVVGIHVLKGANSGSSDADMADLNIIGNDKTDSVGILVEGNDNTFSNIRIGHTQIGVRVRSGGNFFNDVHPLFAMNAERYPTSVGFQVEAGSNTFNGCYSDQYRTGFRFTTAKTCILTDCWVYWWSDAGKEETAISCAGQFNAIVSHLRVSFHKTTENAILVVGATGGTGIFDYITTSKGKSQDETYLTYLKGSIV